MSDGDRANIFSYHENLRWGKEKRRLPVTLLTGPLGAGKTTCLKSILQYFSEKTPKQIRPTGVFPCTGTRRTCAWRRR
jgi:predicted AAA+ superfamily ATPase